MLRTVVCRQSLRSSLRDKRRCFSSFQDAVIHVRGDAPYGSREYVLLPPHMSLESSSKEDEIATLRAHRNILFGAASRHGKIDQLCAPLVQAALDDGSTQGDQVQAMSTLHGLSAWVAESLQNPDSSKVLDSLRNKDADPLVLEAVQAIATGVPRPGHSVVGQGTFRDGESGWVELAKEFVKLGLSEEGRLYQGHQAELVTIEHLADTQPDYLKSAGGAMARFVFI